MTWNQMKAANQIAESYWIYFNLKIYKRSLYFHFAYIYPVHSNINPDDPSEGTNLFQPQIAKKHRGTWSNL